MNATAATRDLASAGRGPRGPVFGLIVNPLAGIGGRAGLKGSDGPLAARALALGARSEAPLRASLVLERLSRMRPFPKLVTCGGEMGEQVARSAGFAAELAYDPASQPTTAADTRAAAQALRDRGVDLLLFVGGDGTACDLRSAVGLEVPVLGVPAGVKMHSGVFATGPRAAGDALERWWHAGRPELDVDIVDREAAADGTPSGPLRLHGSLRAPKVDDCLQGLKASGPAQDTLLAGACERVAALARDERVTVLGPGSTLLAVKRLLGLEGSALGVDVVCAGRLLARDASEAQVLELVAGRPSRIVVTVIGGQGFIFGRGNQQLSPSVIRAVGGAQIVILAASGKLAALPGAALLVDTGDPALDLELAGHRAVITGAMRQTICRVQPADR